MTDQDGYFCCPNAKEKRGIPLPILIGGAVYVMQKLGTRFKEVDKLLAKIIMHVHDMHFFIYNQYEVSYYR